MSASRLSAALDAGDLPLPEEGVIALAYPPASLPLDGLPAGRVQIICRMQPDFDAFTARGYDVVTAPQGAYAAAILCLPRAKAAARDALAALAACTTGMIAVDGQKTDGIESMLKDLRRRATVDGVQSRAHGKLIWLAPGARFDDWAAGEGRADGYVTAPGVFSADAVDPASKMLADALPEKLPPLVADLGAGWGYLSARLAGRPGLEALHLVEADAAALDCARANVTAREAQFHWADATTWQPPEPLDMVVCNPPFHTGRKPDPSLGRAFIAAAAGMLKPSGRLWLVANRHLPYETVLAEHFADLKELPGAPGFKLISAGKPLRPGAGRGVMRARRAH